MTVYEVVLKTYLGPAPKGVAPSTDDPVVGIVFATHYAPSGASGHTVELGRTNKRPREKVLAEAEEIARGHRGGNFAVETVTLDLDSAP